MGVNREVIFLKKNEKYYIDDKFFLIKKGKVVTRDILANGKVIANEYCLEEGEIIGNFFSFSNEKFEIPEIHIEVDALEETELLEFEFSKSEILSNQIFGKVLKQLVQRSVIKFLYQLYDTKGYIMAILKLYANDLGIIRKKEVNYENFNISRSQFYLLFLSMKKEGYLKENKEYINLDLEKIDNYLDKQKLG